MADAADLKSATFTGVWVRVPLPAPTFFWPTDAARHGGLFVWLVSITPKPTRSLNLAWMLLT